ncbi:hypothetical protein [Rhodospirillum sp. A1_3_36]|uniref:hypothetical protein n=1 Tax=Rhodospirillum sp. A1_3_36 TaxID=3391666 RepID=UPI0039A56876
MTKIVQSSVAEFPAALAKAGVKEDQFVFAQVLDAEDVAKLHELRRLAQEGLESGEVSEEEAFEDILGDLYGQYPQLKDG